MIITTTNDFPGREYEVLGMVKGNVVQAKHIGKDIFAGLKNVVGGEIRSYTEMLSEAREIATQRMVAEAEARGADAVLMVRYGGAQIMDSTAEIIAYGTAVKFK
jgi:uncharacterized protein YbjQ (UPF0145 family)